MQPTRHIATAGLALFFLALSPRQADEPVILGFTQEGAARELALEEQFDTYLNVDNLRGWMQRMTLKPRHVGAPYTKETADFIAGQFRSWGYET